jgi:hypothetical protein
VHVYGTQVHARVYRNRYVIMLVWLGSASARASWCEVAVVRWQAGSGRVRGSGREDEERC